jgi:type III secretion protein J
MWTLNARSAFAIMLMLESLSGCGSPEVPLFSNQTERDANEILSALRLHGINAHKELQKGGTVTVSVGDRDFAKAMTTLRAEGLPRQPKPTIPDLFPGDKMFTTPTEENVRIKFALEQEIAQSLTMIQGVRDARVVLVMPNPDPHRDKQATSASVLLIHDEMLDDLALIPRIKRFVQNSVPGLTEDHIAISLFPFTTGELRQAGAEPSK